MSPMLLCGTMYGPWCWCCQCASPWMSARFFLVKWKEQSDMGLTTKKCALPWLCMNGHFPFSTYYDDDSDMRCGK